MIINCPVYLEVQENFTPQEGREFTLALRQYIVAEIIRDTKGIIPLTYTSSSNGKKITLKIKVLSESEAIQRFGKRIDKKEALPPLKEK